MTRMQEPAVSEIAWDESTKEEVSDEAQDEEIEINQDDVEGE